MKQIRDVMTANPRTVGPEDSLRMAAQFMDELNVGVLPVCEGEKVIGMVTDRDIAVRGVAQGLSPDEGQVREVMSASVRTCYDDEQVDDVLDEMADVQIRRVPVLDREQRLVGIVSLGDLAEDRGQQGRVAEALRDISTPSQPDRH